MLGISVAPGSLPSYLVTFSTLLSALLLPPLGAFIDRSGNKKGLLAGFAWTGPRFASLLFFCKDDNWQIGAVAAIGANLCIAASLVVNDSILPDDLAGERARPSLLARLGLRLPRQWAPADPEPRRLPRSTTPFGLSEGIAVRLSMLSAALWWAGFTLIPYPPAEPPTAAGQRAAGGRPVRQSFSQLARRCARCATTPSRSPS